ncbi:PTS transporter subunit EIIC [Streptomyces sp. NPDC047315]|uniref:PTS transporter subunit EIIC n=1 Tax=Streptomyces sp. NPDC047315 TaxID=3155142 RepID=UPI0033F77DB8
MGEQHQDPAPAPSASATALLEHIGGSGNVLDVSHCMTRLRLTLLDRAAVRHEAITALPGVLGVVEDGTSYQVVYGPGVVVRVTEAFENLLTPTPTPTPAPTKPLLRRIGSIFVPLIPALIGCGVVAGLGGLLVNFRLLPGLTPAIAAVSGGFMALIAVFVGYNTAKEFGGTPVLGGAVAAVVVFPGVAKVDAFGQEVVPGQGGVLGALAAALLAVAVERWCRGRVPDALDVLLTPAVTVLFTGLVTVYGLMYAAGEAAAALGAAATALLDYGGVAAGFVLGGLFLPLVMVGLHQALIPIHATLIEQQGATVLLPILAMAGAGQVGAAVAVYARLRRHTEVRATIRSALPAGLLGVGEPLIYGVTLPLGRPFVTACFGGAFGGGFVGLFSMLGDRVGSTAIGPSGWALFPLLRGDHGPLTTLVVYAGGLFVGYAVGFAATYWFGFTRELLAQYAGPDRAPAPEAKPVPEPTQVPEPTPDPDPDPAPTPAPAPTPEAEPAPQPLTG